ncbi:MAG: 50S ribosomal protein L2 [Candidatus Cloacimonetes bacterium]|nr:50S ribosomal protein L2 [Candidatus Cloacimonadota bacterium]MBL7085606.1 50S ribosomal protein L2 [Candidatus Cloacimonadota bacterium]
MAIKKYKPITPSRRFYTGYNFEEISSKKPEKSLIISMKKNAGRNNQGRITIRHRGGGHKRFYRIIDFKRYDKKNIKARVHSIEYDPNRSARIALLFYTDGEKRYIIAPDKLKDNDIVTAGEDVEIKPGNALPLKKIPVGTAIHNVELTLGKGAQIARTAGVNAEIIAKEDDYVHVRMPSGTIQLIRAECYASIGQVSNIDHSKISYGKAGRRRWLGRRPRTRGVAMNPVDHPMGGGEGKSSGGRHPVSPWGMPAKGYKTRKKRKYSDKYIIKKGK